MKGKGILTYIIMVVIGGILGGLAGVALNLTLSGTKVVNYLTKPLAVGIDPPWQLKLNFLKLTFGLDLNISLIVILGAAVGTLLARKL
jgi:hypothetical protein